MGHRFMIGVLLVAQAFVLPSLALHVITSVAEDRAQRMAASPRPSAKPMVLVLDPSGEPAVRSVPATDSASSTGPEIRWWQPEWIGVAHVRRNQIPDLTDELVRLARSPHFVAVHEPGHPAGYRLSGVELTSFLGAAGFRDGDLIHSINGRSVLGGISCDVALAPRPARFLDIAVTRSSRPGRLVIFVDDGLGSEAHRHATDLISPSEAIPAA
jgi:hypothetical protein